MEVSESVCADQFVTFDSLVSSMLSEIGDIKLKLGGPRVGTNFHSCSDSFKESKSNFLSNILAIL